MNLREEIKEDGIFLKDENGEVLAKILFHKTPKKELVITRTLVSPTLRGQGIGQKLVSMVKEIADRDGYSLKSHCSFASRLLNL